MLEEIQDAKEAASPIMEESVEKAQLIKLFWVKAMGKVPQQEEGWWLGKANEEEQLEIESSSASLQCMVLSWWQG
jgi:hypothetical protein